MTKASDILVFDRALARKKRSHISQDHDFLFQYAAEHLNDRLKDINRDFEKILQIGGRVNLSLPNTICMDLAGDTDLIADEEMLPFADSSLDLVLSPLNLHSVNDLPGALIQIRRALKPDGLFIAAMFGGETLYELRDCLTKAELSLSGGLSPRVFPFADKQQMGGLMQRAGFALPVVDSDLITVTYPTLQKLMRDLKGMGESNIISARKKSLTTPRFFDTVESIYKNTYSEDDKLTATFEVIFLTGWAPHASQQNPLRPGSAKNKLSEALGTTEIKTGEKALP